MKLIDKDTLVAEIERRKETWHHQDQQYVAGGRDVCDYLLGFLDAIEVKEVDLDKEFSYKDYIRFFEEHPNFSDDWGFEETWVFAKYFFELGLKAQHDNWKVVDNINLPQEDRTKIYCVFTEQRYILAKVISHPQDDDLLQWKCTEFPHHCYDMCEGDRYMQIV